MYRDYRDDLGRLSAEGCVSAYTDIYSLDVVSDAPEMSWPITTSVEDIVADLAAAGWSSQISKDGYNRPRINCVHLATQAAINARAAQQADEFAGCEAGYLRYGSCPKSGRSKNYRDNTLEAGVSVFNAEFAASGKYRIKGDSVQAASFYQLQDRPAYRVWGEIVGTGADGEPVLRVTKSKKI